MWDGSWLEWPGQDKPQGGTAADAGPGQGTIAFVAEHKEKKNPLPAELFNQPICF